MDTYALEKLTGWTPELSPPPDSPLFRWRVLAGVVRSGKAVVVQSSLGSLVNPGCATWRRPGNPFHRCFAARSCCDVQSAHHRATRAPDDGWTRLSVLAAHGVRGLHNLSSERRGSREDRVHAAPAVSRAIAHRKRAHEHTGSAETLRPSLRNGFTAYFVLSPVNGSFATVDPQKLASANLTPAPRRQDHTTSPYASGAFVLRASRVHHIPPRVRDDRDTPLLSRRDSP